MCDIFFVQGQTVIYLGERHSLRGLQEESGLTRLLSKRGRVSSNVLGCMTTKRNLLVANQRKDTDIRGHTRTLHTGPLPAVSIAWSRPRYQVVRARL